MKDSDTKPSPDHYDGFVEARMDRHAALDEESRKDASRRMWEAAAGLLTKATHGEPLPNEVCKWLSDAIQDTLAKSYPPELIDIMDRGGTSDNVSLKEAKFSAGLYIHACRIRFLNDPSPNKTIREQCFVSDQTVRDWYNKFDPHDWDIFWNDFSRNCSAGVKQLRLLNALKHAAHVLRQRSRSAASIRLRHMKLPPS